MLLMISIDPFNMERFPLFDLQNFERSKKLLTSKMVKVYLVVGKTFEIGGIRSNVSAILTEQKDELEIEYVIYDDLGDQDDYYPYYDLILSVLEKYQNESKLEIYLDNIVVIKSLNTYYKEWEKNGWKTKKGEPVKNAKMMKKILKLEPPNKYVYSNLEDYPFELNKIKRKFRKELDELRQERGLKREIELEDVEFQMDKMTSRSRSRK